MTNNIREQLEELQKKYYLAIDEAFQAKTVLGEKYFEEMRDDLIERYRIERDQLKEKAKIPDKNINFETKLKIYELTPHRCGFLWILKNEARKLKEREADVDDRQELDERWSDLEKREEFVYGKPEQDEEPAQKLSWLKRIFKRRDVKPEPNVQNEEQTEQPAAMGNGSTPDPAAVAPSSELSAAAPDASDATPQSDNPTEINTGKVAEPPATAPTSEKHKRERKRKQPAESTAEPPTAPPAPTAPAPQLSGQINIEELTDK